MDNKINIGIPIAIIIGNNTYSSGEIAAVIFRGRNNVKFFGDKTGGGLSVNKTYKINTNINIAITEKLITSVDGYFFSNEYLIPDIYTDFPIIDAKKWILS